MGVRILQGDQPYDGACLYCSTSGWAFGPVFDDREAAQAFCDWLGDNDPRTYTEQELQAKYHTWLEEVEQQKLEEEQAEIEQKSA